MKIGIITITEGANYGNRLQNYAMQELLKSLGYECETIKRITLRDVKGVQLTKQVFKECVKVLLRRKNTHFSYRRRKKRFEVFNKKYICFSCFSTENNEAPSGLKENYDYFLCGSDQIWNAKFAVVNCDLKNHLASFADPSQRVAFAASFGTNSIAPGYEDVFKEELDKFKAIAVREEAGKKIVDNLLEKDNTEVVLDPTLLIDRKQWINIEKKPKYIGDEKFAVTYFLGGRSDKIQEHINVLADKNGIKTINLESEVLEDKDITDNSIFETDPAEFVWLIHHAEYILTDSFHACAFSVVFEKPFVVFERVAVEKNNNMGSRIDTLLSKFNLDDCRDDLESPTRIPAVHDYTEGYKQLEIERKKAIDFLKKALED